MIRNSLPYKIFGIVIVLVVFASTLNGAEYRGDQYRSPILRFLHNLFLGESGQPTQFKASTPGQTYHFSTLNQGNSPTGASVSSMNPAGSGTAWGTPSTPRPSYTAISSQPQDEPKPGVSVGTYAASSAIGNTPVYGGSSVGGSYSSSSAGDAPLSGSLTTAVISGVASNQIALSNISSTQPFASIALQDNPNFRSSFDDSGDGWGPDPGQPEYDVPVGDGAFVLLFFVLFYLFLIRNRLSLLSRS